MRGLRVQNGRQVRSERGAHGGIRRGMARRTPRIKAVPHLVDGRARVFIRGVFAGGEASWGARVVLRWSPGVCKVERPRGRCTLAYTLWAYSVCANQFQRMRQRSARTRLLKSGLSGLPGLSRPEDR